MQYYYDAYLKELAAIQPCYIGMFQAVCSVSCRNISPIVEKVKNIMDIMLELYKKVS